MLTTSNSWISNVPTLRDEFPCWITTERTKNNIIRCASPWFDDAFCNYGWGATSDNEHKLFFCGAFNIDGSKG